MYATFILSNHTVCGRTSKTMNTKKLTAGFLGLIMAAAMAQADNPPVITSQPEDQTVKEGDSVTFSVVAKENSPLKRKKLCLKS